jgi:aryl-alcohol dehydrogenase-like predicted oxidoreductase
MPHLEQSINALEIDLSDEDVAYLEDAYQPHPVLGHT